MDRLSKALSRLLKEDPSLKVKTDKETGQTILSGMGELHLEVIVDRLLREFQVEATVGEPQVAFRETLTKPVPVHYRHVKQTGGKGQFAEVVMDVEPLKEGAGLEFVDKITGGAIPKEYIKPVEEGIRSAMETGILAGFPVVDVKVTLQDGKFHEWTLRKWRSRWPDLWASRKHAPRDDPFCWSPLWTWKWLPPRVSWDVLGDLTARRGKILGMESRSGVQTVGVRVPLARMFGYATDLRSLTQGRATFTMRFSHYEPAPQSVMEKVVAEFKQSGGAHGQGEV